VKRSVSILGATGSVGTSTLDLIERAPEQFDMVAVTARSDVRKLAEIARRTGAKLAVIADERRLPELREALSGTRTEVAGGERAVVEAAGAGADWTMAAIVGCAG
jgi:1-deoxy-D-xylulose-5-phosphate reductoisomerase